MPRAEDTTILVVDDEPDVRVYLAQALRDAGFTVVTAADGREALAMIRAQPPDLISLDLVMPNQSGHKLLYELRRDPALARIPFVVVTAHARDELGERDLQDLLRNRVLSGPGVYLEKPVGPLDYVRCVQRALGIAESEGAEGAERIGLQEEVKQRLATADPRALRRALEILTQPRPPGGAGPR